MRIILAFLFTIHFASISAAEDFSVFEKDGRFGVKDGTGTVIVPAVYDQLGWSDGSNKVFEDAIGFRRNGLWGLVSVRNRILVENKFFSITPLGTKHIKASVKGRFSNQLFYGLLEADGDILISFNYSDLQMNGDHLTASSFDESKFRVGVINLENEVLVPLEYKNIEYTGNFAIAERTNQSKDIFYDYELVADGLDSIKMESGLIGYKNGSAGFINSSGQLVHDFVFKGISISRNETAPIPFPQWEVQSSSGKVLAVVGDSLALIGGVWVTYLNGAQHFKFEGNSKRTEGYLLETVAGDNLVVRQSKTSKWSVWEENGEVIIEDQDYIEPSEQFFFALNEQKWQIFNSFGSKISSLPFQEVKHAGRNFFIAKHNDYWGVVDFRGDTYITFKYDSIISASDDYYAVKFLNKWGITDKHGNWKVNPEFEQIAVFGNLIVTKKGLAYSFFNDGEFLFRSTFKVCAFSDEFHLIENELGQKGLINSDGQMMKYPSFDAISKSGDYLIFQQGDSSAIFSSGQYLIGFEQGYEEFGEIGTELIAVKRNERWGFIDREGRLRISNRYESVGIWKEGYAAAKLRGRWGFIDENEKLIVQPHYQSVSPFQNNVAIVESAGLFGLINRKGEEVVALAYTTIDRTELGNYLVSTSDGSTGLINSDGAFVLRPHFDSIEDIERGIIVKKDGKVGLLDYDGGQIYNLEYSNIRNLNGLLLLSR